MYTKSKPNADFFAKFGSTYFTILTFSICLLYHYSPYYWPLKYRVEVMVEGIHGMKSPYWDCKRQNLYMVNVNGSQICRFSPPTVEHSTIFVCADVGNESISFITPVKGEDEKFAISYGSSLATVSWDGHSSKAENFTTLRELGRNKIPTGGKVSPMGTFYFGLTNGSESQPAIIPGIFGYKRGQVRKIIPDVAVSSMAWSRYRDTFYFAHPVKRTIEAFSYDIKSGYLSDRRVIFDFEAQNIVGVPVNLVVDIYSVLYVTLAGSNQILLIDSYNNELMQTIDFDAPIATISFGGINMDDIFVVTRDEFDDEGSRLYRIRDVGANSLVDYTFDLE